jgi:hypothetical protein
MQSKQEALANCRTVRPDNHLSRLVEGFESPGNREKLESLATNAGLLVLGYKLVVALFRTKDEPPTERIPVDAGLIQQRKSESRDGKIIIPAGRDILRAIHVQSH